MSIRDIISASGKTREQICEEADISRGFLSLLESGERKIGPKRLARLSLVLGVPQSALRPDLAAALSPSSTTETAA